MKRHLVHFCANWDVNKDCPEVEKEKRRIATHSVEGRCGALLPQTDRHRGPVGWGWGGGEGGETDTETAQIHVLLILLKLRLSLLQQLLVCFKGRLVCHACRGDWGRTHSTTSGLFKRSPYAHTYRHPHKTALWSCSLLPFRCSHPSITKEKVQNVYYTARPLPHPSTMQGQNHSDLDFYIYVYMYTTVCLWGCWIRGRVKSLRWVISFFFSVDRLSTHKGMILEGRWELSPPPSLPKVLASMLE